jgi:tetratricopeptide (TPR) repeat protein
MRIPYRLSALIWLLGSLAASANPFLREVERATPARRVILVLNYFDTCRAVTQNQEYAIRLLNDITRIGEQSHDAQIQRYCGYLRNTWAKHRNRSHADNAKLFLAVGAQAERDNDPQIAAVCRHFAGQYYFLNEEYGKAFEHLLAANKAFREIGHRNIPEISRYLYELAFNYYYFQEYATVIGLLTEAARYPVFSDNLAIQTYNTLGMAYSSRLQTAKKPCRWTQGRKVLPESPAGGSQLRRLPLDRHCHR